MDAVPHSVDDAGNIAVERPGPIGVDEQPREPYVVVGVDGSPGSRAALAHALTAAARRRAALDVVASFPVTLLWTGGSPVDVPDAEAVRADTETRARAFVDDVRAEASAGSLPGADDVAVRLSVVPGQPVPALLRAADGAELLVVGSRGRGAARSALLGSVALHCVSHAPCPVVVVHATADVPPHRVLVGVDGSAGSRAALAAAVDEAARGGAALDVVAAYALADHWTDLSTVLLPSVDRIRDGVLQRTERMVEEVLARSGAAPAVRVHAVEGPAAEVLVDRARQAELLVVGGHGRGALSGLLLGSVALHCAMHAPGPVLVVHPHAARAAAVPPRPEPAMSEG